MNIQAADILSLFPGIDSLDNLQQTLAADTTLPASFANTLMAEIQQLQMALQQGQGGADFSVGDFNPPISDGNLLPAGGNSDPIDLDQTFKTLEEIVSRLETLGLEGKKDQQAIADSGRFLPVADKSLNAQDTPRKSKQADSEESADPVALALAAIQQTLNKTQDPKGDVVSDSPAPFENGAVVKESTLQSERWLAGQHGDKSAGLPAAAIAMSGGQSTDDNSQAEQSFNKNQPVIPDSGQKNEIADDLPESKAPVVSDAKNSAKTMEVAQSVMDLNRAVSSLPQAKPVSATIQQTVGHPQWGTEMADKIVWMAQKQIPSAEINLNPRHLGPVSIQIDVDQDQTRIAFHAHNPMVKESIEAALPRLKEMLAAQQLNLVDVNVSQQQSEQKQSSHAFFQQYKNENGGQGQPELEKEVLAETAASVIDEIETGKAIVSQGVLSLFA